MPSAPLTVPTAPPTAPPTGPATRSPSAAPRRMPPGRPCASAAPDRVRADRASVAAIRTRFMAGYPRVIVSLLEAAPRDGGPAGRKVGDSTAELEKGGTAGRQSAPVVNTQRRRARLPAGVR